MHDDDGGGRKIPHWQLIYEPSSGWEVNGDGGVGLRIILDHDRADHKTLADHKLFIQQVRFIVLGELVPHRPHNWCPLRAGLEEKRKNEIRKSFRRHSVIWI